MFIPFLFQAATSAAAAAVKTAAVAEPTFIEIDRKSTRLNSSHRNTSRMPSSA